MIRYGARIFIITITTILCCACSEDDITGSGNLVEVQFPMQYISRINSTDGFTVDLRLEDATSVSVVMDDNILGYVQVEQDGPTVHFGIDPKDRVLRNITYRATVSMPSLALLRAQDASRVTIVQSVPSREPCSCILSGGSTLGGTVTASILTLDLSGASTAILGGVAYEGLLNVSGGSTCDLRDYPLGECTATAEGGSTVYLHITGTLNVTVSGNSRVYYTGTPVMGNISVEPGSTLEQI